MREKHSYPASVLPGFESFSFEKSIFNNCPGSYCEASADIHLLVREDDYMVYWYEVYIPSSGAETSSFPESLSKRRGRERPENEVGAETLF